MRPSSPTGARCARKGSSENFIPGELAGKLDAEADESVASAMVLAAEVNGPQDDDLDWDAIDRRTVEDAIRLVRRRIFKPSQVGDLKRVRNLQAEWRVLGGFDGDGMYRDLGA